MTSQWSREELTRTDPELARTIELLAERSRARAVEIADDVLLKVLRTRRRSFPIRAHAPWDFVHVSDRVMIAAIRARIDTELAGAAVGKIRLEVDRNKTLTSLTVELFVQFGQVLVDVADRARNITNDVVNEMLGRPEAPVRVAATHVHVSDVTAGDPLAVEPGE